MSARPIEKLPEHTCPECRMPLLVERRVDGVLVYCGYGPCVSEVANDGADGGTVTEAFTHLGWKVAQEIERCMR
jgi:hypothetical protein